MSFSSLLPELWLRILFFVKRPTPHPSKSAPWSDLHQHDLTVTSRVSKAFHDMSSLHLYSTPTTNDLSFLFHGYEPFAKASHESQFATDVRNKNEKLLLVKRLHLYAGPPASDSASLPPGEPSYEPRRHALLEVCIRKDAVLNRLKALFLHLGACNPLVELDTLIIGHESEIFWDDFPFPNELDHEVRMLFRKFIWHLSLKEYHQYGWQSALDFSGTIVPPYLPSTVFTFIQPIASPDMIYGARNIWIFLPDEDGDFSDFDHADQRLQTHLQDIFMRNVGLHTGEVTDLRPLTKLELYGHCRPTFNQTGPIRVDMDRLDPFLELEQRRLEQSKRVFERQVPKEWHENVKFCLWEDRPTNLD